MSTLIKNTTSATFEADVINSPIPVLLDFWAPWCGPCKMITPILSQLADEYKDKLQVVKVNIDNDGELAVQHGVRSIPTLMVFKNGECVETKIGAGSLVTLKALVDKHL